MTKKVVLLAFKGELMCFMHVLLHAIDLHGKGYDVRIIIEGAATKLLGDLNIPGAPFSELYRQVKDAGLIDCVCRNCAAKMGSLPEAEKQRLTIKDEVSGHPGLSPFIEAGYQIITF